MTVDAIVEAAARILESHGFAGYNTNDIARLAGISVGSLYQYFPNKEAITGALIQREMRSLLDAASAIPNEGSGEERLGRLIEVAVDHQLKRPILSRLLDVEEERLPIDDQLIEIRSSLSVVVSGHLMAGSYATAGSAHVIDDVVAIIKGLVDAAGRRGETDAQALAIRVMRAVLGFLG